MDSNKTPSEIIAELCVEAGISKSELARRLEITPSQITRILNGDTKTISSDILIKLTKLFGVSADYLLGITDKKEIIKEKHTTRVPMLLMSSAFPLGRCIEFIESIDDVPQKEMAYAEYYYFSGRHEKAVEYAEMYLNCEDIMLKLSASLIYTFANLSLDRIHSARFGLERLKEYLKEAMLEETDKKTRACCVFVATAAHTLLHIPVGDLPIQTVGLIQQLKAFEILTTDVAVSGNYDDALVTMTINPLVQSEMIAKKILDEMLEAHKQYLPQFFKL